MKTARAVFPNAGVGAAYRKALQSLVREMAADLLARVRTSYVKLPPSHGFGGDYAEVPRLFLDDGVFDAKPRVPNMQRAMMTWGGIWTRKLERLSLKLAWNFAVKNREATDVAVKRSFHDAGLTVKFKPTRGMRKAFDATVADNVALIKSIPQKFLTDVQSAVYANVLKGADLKTLTEDIRQKYGVAHRRAAFIARDQNAKAKAVFENKRRTELGIEEAVWMHSSAGKVPRPTHVAMNGKTYKIADGMYDSAVGHNTWPGVEINCRCTSKAVIEGFE